MAESRDESEVYHRALHRFALIELPASAVTDTAVSPTAGIGAEKLEQQIHQTYAQSGTAVAVTIPIHLARGDGVVQAVKCGSVVACIGDSTVTIDVKKNGTTILSSTKVLNSSNTAYIAVSATLSVTAYNNDDVFTVVITISAGTGTLATGVFVDLVTREAADA